MVIQPGGTSRALKMDTASAWLENVTVIGETTFQVTTGGAIYMTGGTITNCVIRSGTAKANGNVAGGNLYVNNDAALVTDCEIYGGSTHKRGGNVYLDRGLVRNCVIHDGVCDDNIGGNIYQYLGTISNCLIYAGSALNDGGNVRMNGAGTMVDCVISNGAITSASSASKKGANVFMDSTAKMSRCRLVGGSHSGGYNGGSLAIGSETAITEDCLIEGSECGGVLFTGTAHLYSCTVINNDKFGIWAWNASAHVFNTVIYGNTDNGSNKDWTGNLPGASGEFLNNAVTESGSRHTADGYPTVVLLADDSAFADYASGDYSLGINVVKIDSDAPNGNSHPNWYESRAQSSMSFPTWNLREKFGKANYQLDYYDFVLRRLDAWGINTIGNWSDGLLTSMSRKPYAIVAVSKPSGLPYLADGFYDTLDPTFAEKMREAVAAAFAVPGSALENAATDPMCIGFFIDNELTFPSDGAYFEPYFKACREALAAAAPGKLYLGCRFKGLRNPEALWLAAAKWCDVISANSYVNSVEVFGRGSYAAPAFDKPVLHSEFHFGTMHRGMFSAGLCPVGDQCERARCFRRVVEGALRHPLFVGSHWFQYRDQPLVGRGDGENYQIGFVDVCDRTYPMLTGAARAVAEEMYELRSSSP